jgi:hypothetical protein
MAMMLDGAHKSTWTICNKIGIVAITSQGLATESQSIHF